MRRLEFKQGQTIFSQGERGEYCYELVRGAVEIRLVTCDANGQDEVQILQEVAKGEVFGEMSLIAGIPRTAGAFATEDSSCVAYTADEFVELLETEPEEALDYIRILIKRLRNTNDMVLRFAMRG